MNIFFYLYRHQIPNTVFTRCLAIWLVDANNVGFIEYDLADGIENGI